MQSPRNNINVLIGKQFFLDRRGKVLIHHSFRQVASQAAICPFIHLSICPLMYLKQQIWPRCFAKRMRYMILIDNGPCHYTALILVGKPDKKQLIKCINSNGHCKENIPIRKQFKKKSRKWNTGEDLEVLKVANQMISQAFYSPGHRLPINQKWKSKQ